MEQNEDQLGKNQGESHSENLRPLVAHRSVLRRMRDAIACHWRAVRKIGLTLGHVTPGHLSLLRTRLVVVLLLALSAFIFDESQLGRQLGLGLHYLSLVLISICVSWGVSIAVVNCLPALAWLILVSLKLSNGIFYGFVTWLNRTLGHIEATLIGTLLIMAEVETAHLKMLLLAALFLLAEPMLDATALYWIQLRRTVRAISKSEPSAISVVPLSVEKLRQTGAIHWTRRPLINAATIVAGLLLVLLEPAQWHIMVPLLIGLVGGALLRLCKWAIESRRPDRRQVRAKQVPWARLDLPILMGGGVVIAAVAWNIYEGSLARASVPHDTDPQPWCAEQSLDSVTPQLKLFIVADTQLHKLDGERFPGQMQLAETLVPVARRPVELDLLAEATLRHFQTIYTSLDAEHRRDNEGQALPWIYLGDLTDLACQGEMNRMLTALKGFGFSNTAGVAPGNHDNSFTGNFAWSPYWSKSCRLTKPDWFDEKLAPAFAAQCQEGSDGEVIATKEWSDGKLKSVFQDGVTARGGSVLAVERHTVHNYWIKKRALAMVTPLGELVVDDRKHGVIGVFVDTTDQIAFDYGVAGEVGAFSVPQADALLERTREMTRQSGYEDPYYVVFSHHQVGSLRGNAKDAMLDFVRHLEGGQQRIIGFVSAHTHRAQKKSFCMGGRQFDELIVGSTVDPPQEVAVLSIGTTERGRPALSVSTIAAVERPAMVCDDSVSQSDQPNGLNPALSAAECKQVVGRLAEHPQCGALFERDDDTAGQTCASLEKDSKLLIQVQTLISRTNPRTTDELHEAQMIRAKQLFQCLCRDGAPSRPSLCDQLSTEATLCDSFHVPLLNAFADDPIRLKELACLGWAASAVQAHKGNGMEMSDALRCSFGDQSIQGTRVMTTDLVERSCF